MTHSPIHVAGIDWASDTKHRAAVTLACEPGSTITVREVIAPLDNDAAVSICRDDALACVGVDIPFGWPRQFTSFAHDWSAVPCDPAPTNVPDSRHFRLRTTDRVVHEVTGRLPMSVSADRIGSAARAWVALVQAHGLHAQVEVGIPGMPAMSPRLIEVYPAAAIDTFRGRGRDKAFRKTNAEHRAAALDDLAARHRITMSAAQRVIMIATDHAFDALLAALSALAFADGLPGFDVLWPTAEQYEDAKREGWIFVPVSVEH